MDGVWEYVGEGGKHALFAATKFPGKLLRVDKSDLRAAAHYPAIRRDQSCDVSTVNGAEFRLSYFNTIIAPKLVPYVEIPEMKVLDWRILNKLRSDTVNAGVIPDARKKDWEPDCEGNRNMEREVALGLLITDYRVVPASLRHPDTLLPSRRLVSELKPKAGYLPVSPLVQPNHRVKLTKSRFCLLQKLHQQGFVGKGWAKTADGIEPSTYEPIELFSGDGRRIQTAIRSLFDSPQNNFKIWYCDQAVIKNGELDSKVVESALKGVLENTEERAGHASSETCFRTMVSELLREILRCESVLGKLQRLQKLDILDVDGAVIVTERLFKLCRGSRQEVEALISSVPPRAGEESIHGLLSSSPFGFTAKRSTGIKKYCQLTERYRDVLSSAAPALPAVSFLDDFFAEALAVVEKFSAEECAFLLANWLFSLAMCDVSIFITLEKLSLHRDGIHRMASRYKSTPFIETQSDDGRGIVRVSYPNAQHASPLRFSYMVKLVDCDGKSPEKLWGRDEKEAAFARLQM